MTHAPAVFAALRIARRDAWRHKARSSLVVLMIALPVLGLTSADVLARTYQLSTTDKIDRAIGQADVRLFVVGGGRLQQSDGLSQAYFVTSPSGKSPGPVTPGTAAFRTLERRALAELPPGSRAVDDVTYGGTVAAGNRLVNVLLHSLDLRDPMTKGMAELRSGHLPSNVSGVAVTPGLASRLDLHVGSTVTVARHPRTVTAIVVDPSDLKTDEVYGVPGSLPTQPGITQELVTTSKPVTWSDVLRLNAIGVGAISRYAVTHPPAVQPNVGVATTGRGRETIGLATVAIGLAVLEVVLLAGAAFAVGARRARRDLALVSATGGQPGDVRNIVLAGGIVLGVTGAVIGVAGGVAASRGLVPLLNHFAHHAPGSFDVRPLELLAAVVLGIVTGVLASVLPARSAGNVDVVAALTGRRGVVSTARRVPLIGLSGVVVGALIAGYGAHPPVRFTAILVGAVVSELGFVMCAPAFVGLAGRLAKWAPLSPRMALRDAARHRGRTGPAVAAIMAAIAGSIAVTTYFVSQQSTDRANYNPQARIGQTLIQGGTPHQSSTPKFHATLAAAMRGLGGTGSVAVPLTECLTDGPCTSAQVNWPDSRRTPPNLVAVGGPALLASLAGGSDPRAATALDAGAVVALDPGRSDDLPAASARAGPTLSVTDGAVHEPVYVEGVGRAGSLVGAILSPATARTLHVAVHTNNFLIRTSTLPSQPQQDKAQAAFNAVNARVYVERGYVSPGLSAGLLVLLAVSAIVTLGATGITTGLSVAESRPDLTTLSAVGAAPLTRRLVVASQSATMALLGAVLGVMSGLIPAWAVVQGRTGMTFALPWETIGLSLVAIPVIAVLVTSAFVRAPSMLVRRES